MILLLPLFLSFILYILKDKDEIITIYSIITLIIYNMLISIGMNVIILYIIIILLYWLINENNKLYSQLYLITLILIIYSNSLYAFFISIELVSFIMITYINFYIQDKYYGILYYLFSGIFTALFIISIGYIYMGYNIFMNILIFVFIWKLGLGPLHILIPKIYNNLSVRKIIFIDIICKYLLINLFYRLLISVNINFFPILIISLIIGTLLTLNETNLLNISIYSSLINYSFILLFINYYQFFIFYLFSYIIMTLIFFYLIIYINLSDIRSIHNIYYVILWFLLIINFMGLPPSIGFWIKFNLLYTLILSLNYFYLFIILVSLILLNFVYIRIILHFLLQLDLTQIYIFNVNSFNSHFISTLISLLIFPLFYLI